jgi:hypothetical protein
MNYSVEMGLGAIIYVPSFIEINSKVNRGIHIQTDTHVHTHRQDVDLTSLL